MPPEKIKIFVADDHPIVREGLIAVLETQDDFEVVGEATDGEDLLQKLSPISADVLFLDLAMPKKDGLEVIRQLQTEGSPVKVIIFTIFDTDERIVSAIKVGAKGYLLKGARREEIFKAVRVVQSGGSLLQPVVASKLFQHISKDGDELSPRELEVLSLLAKGHKNKDIAAALFISERTVKFHVSAILGKLGVRNRTQAAQVAVKRGLIEWK